MTQEIITNPNFEMSQEDMMINILQSQKQMKEQIQSTADDVHYLKNIQPVNPSVTKVLENKRRACVVKWLGGKDTPAYKEMSRQVFSEAGHDFKEMFNINRYDLLRKKDEETALGYWDSWEPSTNTKIKIYELNNQTTLSI